MPAGFTMVRLRPTLPHKVSQRCIVGAGSGGRSQCVAGRRDRYQTRRWAAQESWHSPPLAYYLDSPGQLKTPTVLW